MKSWQDQQRIWLRRKLEGAGRGARVALAQHLGIRPDAISRILGAKEGRDIKLEELIGMAQFFNEEPPGLSAMRTTDNSGPDVPPPPARAPRPASEYPYVPELMRKCILFIDQQMAERGLISADLRADAIISVYELSLSYDNSIPEEKITKPFLRLVWSQGDRNAGGSRVHSTDREIQSGPGTKAK